MCLGQGHNAVTLVRLEPVTPWSRINHSTTEPLRPIHCLHTHKHSMDVDEDSGFRPLAH